ncbi:MAG: DUF447 family protein [Methylotenera sp.]|nr:DUF447 family protein [Methylotenera sp.]
MIYEAIISTVNSRGDSHVAPFGIQMQDGLVLISPYKPSVTLDNILATQHAVLNLTDDVRVFSGALTRRQAWALLPAEKVMGFRLADSLLHKELTLVNVVDDALRPQLTMEVMHEVQHLPFQGFNRAQAAVIELAVLVSRLHLLAKDKVLADMKYLQIAIDKTAGERELQAWCWLTEKVENYYAEQAGKNFA